MQIRATVLRESEESYRSLKVSRMFKKLRKMVVMDHSMTEFVRSLRHACLTVYPQKYGRQGLARDAHDPLFSTPCY